MFAQQHVSLCYSGYLSEEVLAGLSSMLRSTVAADNQDENMRKRVFSVFIEQAQNVMRYSADQLQDPTVATTASELLPLAYTRNSLF